MADGKVLFNDMLGSTVGTLDKGKYTATNLNLFGKKLDNGTPDQYTFFTGKPHVSGLGYSFLFRNYREDLSKWQTSDPLGYPDGWNNFAYVNNGVTNSIDWLGAGYIAITGTIVDAILAGYSESTYTEYDPDTDCTKLILIFMYYFDVIVAWDEYNGICDEDGCTGHSIPADTSSYGSTDPVGVTLITYIYSATEEDIAQAWLNMYEAKTQAIQDSANSLIGQEVTKTITVICNPE